MRFPLGDWLPDLSPLKNQQGLSVCENVVPVAGGYGPQAGLLNLDSFALSGEPRGAIRGQLTDGTNFFIAGTALTLERRLEASWLDVSRTVAYTDLVNRRWELVQFGSNVFATNYADPMQAINLASDTQFGDVAGAPRAYHLTVAENFLMGGDIFSSTLGVARDAVAWSGLGDGYQWPDPTTDLATQVLSGEQKLEGDGGIVQSVVSGSEVVGIFQENAIHRADFVGGDVVWRFQRMIRDHGVAIKGAAIEVERGVLFIASDGFRLFNYTTSTNIGKERVNDFFFDDFDSNYPDSLSMVRDPDQTRILISYAGSGNSNGQPNHILVWDYVLNRWSLLLPGIHFDLIGAGGIAASLDSPDTVEDPDRIGGEFDDEDPPGDESFDDRQLGAGVVSIGAFDSTFRLGEFNGVNLVPKFETGDLELVPGWRSLLTEVRPQIDGERTSLQVAGLAKRAEDTEDVSFGKVLVMDKTGKCNPRVDARYHRLRILPSTQFTEATDYDCTFHKTSKR